VSWVISLSAWTPHYRHKLRLVALPSINAALAYATGPIKFILHTDAPDEFKDVHFAGDVEFRHFIGASDFPYQSYGNCDRMALESAPEDCNIAFLTSDIIVSREFFSNAEKQFAKGKRAIVGHAARTLAAPEHCPAGLSARQLLGWSLSGERLHPVTAGCMYGQGHNLVAWCTYFQGPHGVIAHAFHMHPFAVVNDRHLWFNRETCDLDLLERFSRDEIYVACDPDEFAWAEISGLEKAIPQLPAPVSVGSIVSWARLHTTPLQRWLFSHRILVQGMDEDHLDEAPCKQVLEILEALG
jgi:hypothetical protein